MRKLVLLGALMTYVSVSAASVFTAAQAAPAAQQERTVWDGVFTANQAERGRSLFNANCAECHGEALQGGEGKALSGDTFWTSWRETTVDYLLQRISQNMPFAEDGSLAGTLPMNQYEDIVAHILNYNGFPAGGMELKQDTIVGVRIIAKDGPGELPASTPVMVVGCLARGEGGSGWRIVSAGDPRRVLGTDPQINPDAPLGDREFPLMFVLTSLNNMVDHKVSVRGLLIGEGGSEGINTSGVTSIAETCQ